MDLIKVGKFIQELRKEKNLTQEKLGELLSVNRKTISKWENGVYAPDISLLETLSKQLDVSVSELLNGERITANNNIEIEAINYYNNQYKKKLMIILVNILVLILILTVFYAYLSNYYNYRVSYLTTDTKNFDINGTFVFNKSKAIIIINNIAYNDTLAGTLYEIKYKELKVSIISDNQIIESYSIESNKLNGETLNEGLRNISFYYEFKLNDVQLNKDKLSILLEYIDNNNDNHLLNVDVYIKESLQKCTKLETNAIN